MHPRTRAAVALALGLGLSLGVLPPASAEPAAPDSTTDTTTEEPLADRGPVPLAEDPEPVEAGGYAPGHVLVRFEDDATSSQQRSALSSVDGSSEGTVADTGFVKVDVGDDDPQAVAAALADDPRVAEVQVDHIRQAAGRPNDPLLSSTWQYLQLTRLPRAWDVTTGTGAVIAVLDSGVASGHEDLAGNVLAGYDAIDGDTDSSDVHGHGTLVAGIAAARGNNGRGMAGAAYGAKVLPVRVLDSTGHGTDEVIAEGIRWAVTKGADVINLSLGGPEMAPVLRSAIVNAVAAGVVVVAAAGNDGTEAPFYPAAYAPEIAGLLAVGATDDAGSLTSFSSWGDWVTLAAPGSSIVGPARGGKYASGSGTSFAAPQVSGAAALLVAQNKTRTPAQVEKDLVSTARDAGPRGVDAFYGHGVLDAAAAVTLNTSVRAAIAVPLDRTPGDAGADDDSPARPRAMTLTGTLGTLAPEGDVDWYRASVPAAGWYDVRIDLPYANGAQEVDPVLEVRDAQGRVLGRTDAGGPDVGERVAVPVPAAGPILVGVSSGTGHASRQRYKVSVTLSGQQVRFGSVGLPGAQDTRSSATGDVTGDGVVDIVTTAPGATFTVYPGDGDGRGSLAPPVDVELTGPAATGNGIATVDVDGDGDLDVVVAVATGFQLVLQDGGALTPGAVIPTTATTGGSLLVPADIDLDGDTDLVLTGFADSSTQVAVNDGSGGFTLGASVPTGATRLAVGEVTGDGLPDIVTSTAVFAQVGGGGFAAAQVLPTVATAVHVAVADVTGDGRPDVVRTDGAGWLYVSPKASTAGFGTAVKVAAGTKAGPLVLADIDGDGRTDALVGNPGTISLLRQKAGGTFGAPEVVAPLTSAPNAQDGAFRVVDLDGAGTLDIVLTPNTYPPTDAVVVLHRLSLSNEGAERGWFTDLTPARHAAGAAVRPTVKVVAGRDLAPGTLTSTTVRMIDGQTGATVATTATYASATRTVSITPTKNLSPGGHYEVVVSGLTDTEGYVQDVPLRTWFTVAANGNRFTPVAPVRVLDTRVPVGVAKAGKVASGKPVRLDLSKRVPAGTTAVVLNVTAHAPSAPGNVRVYPTTSGGGAPKVSNLNVVQGVDQPNLVTVGLGADGSVTLLAESTSTHLIADLAGYYSPGAGTAFEPVAPVRLMDLRDGTGGVPVGRLAAGRWVDLKVAGRGGVPADASAVVLNVTGTQVSGATHVRVYPSPGAKESQTPPDISNLNLTPGRDQPNLVTVRLGDGGRVRFYIHTAAAFLLADVAGYYTATGDHGFVPLTPTRIADTRSKQGFAGGTLRSGVAAPLRVGGVAGVPSTAAAAVLNVTGSNPRGVTHVRAFPTTVPATLPDISTINLVPGRDEANLAVVRLGDSGRASFYPATAAVDVIVDVSGYFRK